MNPLARIGTLKLKLGLVIVLAILVTLVTMLVAARLGLRLRWGALVALTLSLGSVQLVAHGMIAPLRAMARAAEAMARGEHGQRVVEPGRDEVGQLAVAFNTMAAELDSLDRARRDLVADAAHELRTPISVLRAQLENAVDGVQPADLPALLEQTERLGRLADQLLDLSALEAGGTTLTRRAFPVADLVAGCDVTRAELPDGLHVRGDPDRLRQVVANLVENGRRHAPGAPLVVRATARVAGGVRIEVEDHGPGLPDGEAERVFDRFARADRSRSVPGSGLGLAIARSIVELHGGVIHAEAVAPHGCRMVVDLP
ncbi:Signal transduction histidine-protein kinase BaeS [Paraconexibacter sp. AEG42_29]|uniref:Signal transduction histidine-protein kinase/phosphatase MprB n=1 Tax=Paraconexibacter sp. AEG42_29 TaxID=2997339 RepID=A0AAU7AYW8_9ACTN